MVDINPNAAANIKALTSSIVGDDVQVSIERGVNVSNYKPGASEENLQFVFKGDKFKDPKLANEIGLKLLAELHKNEDLREQVVLLSPTDQLAFNKKEIGELQEAAKAAGVPFPPNTDFTQAAVLDSNLSRNQLPKHATMVIDGPDVTSIRINVPTDPTNLEGAETLAQQVEADLNKRLPEIKAAMIKRIEEKSYAKMTPEMKAHFEAHEFKVSSQQQSNWTSVFINIRSPEQVKVRDNPEEKGKIENAALEKTNMLQQIENADQRQKIAARAAMFEGEKLGTPASYFMKVAGTEDIKIGLGKMLKFLTAKKPEFQKRSDALMKENFLVSGEEWNLPPDKQPIRKRPAQLGVKAGKDELKLDLYLPIGKGDELLAKLAGGQVAAPEAAEAAPAAGSMTSPDLDKIVNDALAASGAIAACAQNEIAVAGAGAAVTGDGQAVSGAGAACLPAPEVAEVPIVEKKEGIVLPSGQKISNKAISSFLKEVRSFSDRAEDKSGSLGLGA